MPHARATRGTATLLARLRPSRRDGGAAAVEAALLLPAFIAFVFGIIEGSLLMNSNLTLANTTADASREAAVFGKDADADFLIVNTVQERLKTALVGDPIQLVIWHASGLDDTIPPGCEGGTASSVLGQECNVYTPGDGAWESTDPTDNFWDCTSPSTKNGFWCPTDRKDAASPSSPDGPPDYVGIHLTLQHDMVTGFIGRDITLVRNSIARIEPKTID